MDQITAAKAKLQAEIDSYSRALQISFLKNEVRAARSYLHYIDGPHAEARLASAEARLTAEIGPL